MSTDLRYHPSRVLRRGALALRGTLYLSFVGIALWGLSGCSHRDRTISHGITIYTSGSGVSWQRDTVVAVTGCELHSIWGASPTQVFVSGSLADGSSRRAVVWRWDGSQWQEFYSRPSAEFMGIFGVSSQSLWVVGDLDPIGSGGGALVSHWDGQHWEESLSDRSFPGLLSVWASSDQDVYAAGLGSAIFHFDGTAWKRDSVPMFGSSTSWIVFDVWGRGTLHGDQEIYAATWRYVLRKSRGQWTTSFRSPEKREDRFTGVWVAADGEAFALDVSGRGDVPYGALYSFNGSKWDSTDVHGVGLFTAVKGDPAGHIYVVGNGLYRYGEEGWAVYRDFPMDDINPINDLWISGSDVFLCATTGGAGVMIRGDLTNAVSR